MLDFLALSTIEMISRLSAFLPRVKSRDLCTSRIGVWALEIRGIFKTNGKKKNTILKLERSLLRSKFRTVNYDLEHYNGARK